MTKLSVTPTNSQLTNAHIVETWKRLRDTPTPTRTVYAHGAEMLKPAGQGNAHEERHICTSHPRRKRTVAVQLPHRLEAVAHGLDGVESRQRGEEHFAARLAAAATRRLAQVDSLQSGERGELDDGGVHETPVAESDVGQFGKI